jgi:hypothetical protein
MFRLGCFQVESWTKKASSGSLEHHYERLLVRSAAAALEVSNKLGAAKRVMEHFERQQCFVAAKRSNELMVCTCRSGRTRWADQNAQILKAAWKKSMVIP